MLVTISQMMVQIGVIVALYAMCRLSTVAVEAAARAKAGKGGVIWVCVMWGCIATAVIILKVTCDLFSHDIRGTESYR